jgi:hypothetical protein
MKSDWSVEKKLLEQHLSSLKEQLKEKEDKLNLITAQKVVVGFFLFPDLFLRYDGVVPFFLFFSLFFFLSLTGTAFRRLFSANFQSFNPVESFDIQGWSPDFLAYESHDNLRSQCCIAPNKCMYIQLSIIRDNGGDGNHD